jgi:hypothetical protein
VDLPALGLGLVSVVRIAGGVPDLALAPAGAVDVDGLLGRVLVEQDQLCVFEGEDGEVVGLLAFGTLLFEAGVETRVGCLDAGVLDVGAGVNDDQAKDLGLFILLAYVLGNVRSTLGRSPLLDRVYLQGRVLA